MLDSIDFSTIEVHRRDFSDELHNALKHEDINMFRKIIDEIDQAELQSKKPALEKDHGDYTMLQYACDNGLMDFVKELLKHGADPLHETNKMIPVLYAARRGYYEILDLLLQEDVRLHLK